MLIKVARAMLWLIYVWVTITIALLFLGFLLQLLGADQTAGFVEWVYRSTERAMAPFRGIFDSVNLSDDSVLDVSILFAIIVYGFVAIGLQAALGWATDWLHAQERRQRENAVLTAQAAAANPAPPLTASRTVNLTGPNGSTATAALTDAGTGTYVDLTTVGLDSTRQYTVWMENATRGRLTVGTFQPTDTGPSRITTTSPMLLGDAALFGVTMLGQPGEAGIDVFAARLV